MSRKSGRLTLALAPLIALAALAATPTDPPPEPETGLASWYGYPYHGRQAASGEVYDMEQFTAAHRTLPFQTRVRVTNLENQRSVDVRITDRGPFIDGRIIDLSRAAARQVAMLGPGTAQVRIRVVALPAAIPAGYFAVQIGAFRNRANAERERARLATRYGQARLSLRDGDPPLWRVLVGQAATPADAAALAARVRAEIGAAFVVRVEAGQTD